MPLFFRADNERKKLKFICILTLMIGVDEMEWIERLNQAIAYIEEHLKDDSVLNITPSLIWAVHTLILISTVLP